MSHYKRDWDGSACRSVLALGFIRQESFHLRPVGHPFVDTSNKGMWLTSTQESVNLASIVMWHSNHFQPWLTDFHHIAAYRIEPEAMMNKEKRSRAGLFCVSCHEWMKWRWPWESVLMTLSGFVSFCFFMGPVLNKPKDKGEACTQEWYLNSKGLCVNAFWRQNPTNFYGHWPESDLVETISELTWDQMLTL